MRGSSAITCRWLLGVLPLALALLVSGWHAAAQPAETEAPDDEEIPPAVIAADEITYDEALETVIARGNVEIAHGERILLAESVRYDQRNDSVAATGNVVLLEPTGEVMFADYIELSDQLRSGVIENIRVLLADDSRFAANGAKRVDGRMTIMRRAVFSPCEVCEEDPTRPPLWQLKASTIVHDQESRDIKYTNAWLEMFGIPVVYTPYLTHPDPLVERRSGLLTPEFGSSSIFGAFGRFPMYLVFGDSVDATIEPIVTSREPPILAGEYRQRFNKGALEISGSATKADRETGDPANPVIEDADRGHIFAKGLFDLNDEWRWGFDYQRASDPTYLSRYDFFGKPPNYLTSTLFIDGFHGRTYTAGNILGFQDLGDPDPEEDPLVAPIADYNFVGEADWLGGRWTFDANIRNHIRDDGPDSQRISGKAGYAVPFVSDFGLVTTLSASVEVDGYYYDERTINGQPETDVTAGRVVPRLAAQWRLPFVRGTTGLRQLVEPLAAVVIAPNNGNPQEILEEDTGVFELDDTNLFSEDQIPGIDRADLGQRAVYGLNAGLYGEHGGRLTAFFGQSYRVPNDSNENLTTDERAGLSDYVGRVEIVPNKYLDLLYRFRLSEQDFDPLRNELGLIIGPPAFQLSGDYIFIASEVTGGAFPDREQLLATFSSQITDLWSLGLETRRDLTPTGGPLEHIGLITYEDECFRLDLRYRRNFTSSIEIEPSTTFSVQLVFKSLGNVSARQTQTD
ncbi:MAG: LPS-assembly protein LptD [Rhodospirillales bacterium]|nr:MAG: LPS-assembly protein LptD [Rhodospirillales bacterium]